MCTVCFNSIHKSKVLKEKKTLNVIFIAVYVCSERAYIKTEDLSVSCVYVCMHLCM